MLSSENRQCVAMLAQTIVRPVAHLLRERVVYAIRYAAGYAQQPNQSRLKIAWASS